METGPEGRSGSCTGRLLLTNATTIEDTIADTMALTIKAISTGSI